MGVRVAVDSLTIEIHAEGKATVTVTAADSAGLIARQAFEIKQPPTDREILEIFYHATGGAHWANNANWLTDAPLEEWYGITADRAGLVIEIHLFENRLAGPIPSGAWLPVRLAKALVGWQSTDRCDPVPVGPSAQFDAALVVRQSTYGPHPWGTRSAFTLDTPLVAKKPTDGAHPVGAWPTVWVARAPVIRQFTGRSDPTRAWPTVKVVAPLVVEKPTDGPHPAGAQPAVQCTATIKVRRSDNQGENTRSRRCERRDDNKVAWVEQVERPGEPVRRSYFVGRSEHGIKAGRYRAPPPCQRERRCGVGG